MQWENKAPGHSVSEAVDDIHEKTAVWSPMYYGDIEVRVWCGVAFVQEQWGT
jgi:hypothetical protein